MIAIGGIIGAGLFVGSSVAIKAAGPACVISYALTGGLVFLLMRMLGEMSLAIPGVRSFIGLARLGLGPWAGFAVGWLYWYFWVIVIPIEAIAGATILAAWLPLQNWLLGLLLLGLMTAINFTSARAYGEFEFWFSSVKVIAIIAFILISASYALGLSSPSGPTLSNLVSHGGFAPHGGAAVLATVATVITSMQGAEVVTIAAAESEETSRSIARLTFSVIIRVWVFFVLSVLMIVSVVPWNEVTSGESPFTRALQTMHVPWAPTMMSVIILTAVMSCLNSAFYVSSRVLFFMAESGDAPRSLVKTNARLVPARALLLASAAGVIGVLAATFSPSVVFSFLINASGATMLLVYIAIALSQVRLRRMNDEVGGSRPALVMWLFPWLSYFVVAAMVAVLLAMACTPKMASQFWISMAAAAGVLASYTVVRRRRLAATFQVPYDPML
jgi:GABA permease